MKKWSLLGSLVLLAGLLLSACGNESAKSSDNSSQNNGAAPSEEKIVIKWGHTTADNTSQHYGAMKFKELIEERSGGKIEVQVFPANQLGNEKDLVEGNIIGTVQISTPSIAMISNYAPKFNVLALPYIIKGENEHERYENFKKLATLDVFNEMVEEAEAAGLHLVAKSIWWYGDRHITTKGKDIVTPEDVKGLKIRTPDAKAHAEPFNILGASVITMPFTEVYMALSTGTIEAQENPVNTIATSRFAEVQDRINLTGHMTQAQLPAISKKWWDTLSSEDQQLIEEAIIEAGEYQSQKQLELNQNDLEQLEKDGMKVVKSDQALFREATKDVYKSFLDKFSPELYQEIIDAQN